MKKNNKLFLIIIFLLIFYTINDDFKLLINTNYNKYTNILESNIDYLHNKLLNKSSIIDNRINNEIRKNLNKSSTLFENLNLVILLTIFTGIFFIFINFFNKTLINSTSVSLYLILIIITIYLFK